MKKSELVAQLQTEIAMHGDGEVSGAVLNAFLSLTDNEQRVRGEYLAEVLMLKKDTEHKDRFQTNVGTKRAIGIFATVRRIIFEGATV